MLTVGNNELKEYRDHVNEIKCKLEAAEEKRLINELIREVWK